jgi:1-acyl-sn-glycerol-3-phosphate acyltransferase
MDRLPPRIVRRLVIAPLVLVLCLVLLAVSPVVLLVATIVDLFLPGDRRTLRLLGFLMGYAALEVAGLVTMLGLWIASGFGVAMSGPRMQRRHYGFMRWWLRRINKIARAAFGLRVHIEDAPQPRPGPILVFCRHAGPGNSLLLIGTLIVGYGRFPRIVMLAKLQWEPLYDVMLNRLPNRFIRHDPTRRHLYVEAIEDLAGGLGPQDAFVLFPEGKNFTPGVRRRAIDYLRGKGLATAADRAEKMVHTLPPRHGGVMAAMRGAPDADVVLVAHSVLEDVGSFKELWGRIPFDRPVTARYWRMPQGEVPATEDELIGWLYDWWERIDAWIAARTA